MTGLVRKVSLLTACGLIAAASAFATTVGVPLPSACSVPCAIVLVGNNAANNAADPYGAFDVIISDGTNLLSGAMVTVDFTGCCPDIKLSNTQLGAGVTHAANAAYVTGTTDQNGKVTFIIQGAASQAGGPSTATLGTSGCATISATPSGGSTVLLTNDVDHPTVIVSTPDENGPFSPGVDVIDLSVWVADKNAYFLNTADHHQRSDFDYHLPANSCSAIFNPIIGFGVNVLDLLEWVKIKMEPTYTGFGSLHNGPFPAGCP